MNMTELAVKHSQGLKFVKINMPFNTMKGALLDQKQECIICDIHIFSV